MSSDRLIARGLEVTCIIGFVGALYRALVVNMSLDNGDRVMQTYAALAVMALSACFAVGTQIYLARRS